MSELRNEEMNIFTSGYLLKSFEAGELEWSPSFSEGATSWY